jgi:D-3-phosphoglycerate dehydrogenase
MADRRVVITTSYLDPGDAVHTRLTEAGCDVVYARPQDRQGSERSLAEWLDGARCVIAGNDAFTAEVIESATDVGLIARTGVGYDGVDQDAARRCGVTVCNTPGVNRQSVAELTISFLLAGARHLVPAVEVVQSGQWSQRSGRELAGATLGVIGLGAIGKSVASIALALGMRVLAHDPFLDEAFARANGIESRDMLELLAESDFVTVHIALSPETHHLIDADAIARMKPTAYLVNTARGGIVDEEALAAALTAGTLAGAALDVVEQEPLAAEHVLRGVPNLLITPHIAGATVEARTRSSLLAAEQVLDFLDGRPLTHAVVTPEPEAVRA